MKGGKWILLGITIIILIGAIYFYNNTSSIVENDSINRTNEVEVKGIQNLNKSNSEDETSPEAILMKAISAEGNTDISQVLKYMDEVDYNEFEDIYGENSVIELLEWLGNQDISKKEDILILINSIDNFYGKEYFFYIKSLSNAYIDSKFEFIRALAEVPERLEDIGYALNYMGVYNLEGQNMWKDLDKIANSKELNEEERQIGMDLIYFYSECST
ncbi:MAG: hypothetical protein GX968_04080 [Tissierellia bacterium]|nr:hypothetical protein [Tissierellia bacterium]